MQKADPLLGLSTVDFAISTVEGFWLMVSDWIGAARPKTLAAAVMPVILGCALSWQAWAFELAPALMCMAFALLVQIGANFANDYFDFLKGADTPERLGPPRAVASGRISPSAMKWATVVVFAAAVLCGSGLIYFGGWWMLLIGVLCIGCAIAYTGGPYPLGYHGLGEVFVFVFFGLVAVMFTFYVQAGYFSLEVFLTSVVAGALTTNILVVNNCRDAETDAQAGKMTLAARYGRGFACREYQVLSLVTLAATVLLWRKGAGTGVLLPVTVWPLSLILRRRMVKAVEGPEYNALLGATAFFLVLYGGLLATGIVLGG